MPDQAPTVQGLCEQLSRFDEHAHRVAPGIADRVRAVMGERITELGGEPPPHVDLRSSPRAAAAAAISAAAAVVHAPFEEALQLPQHPAPAMASVPIAIAPEGDEFDFDLDATPISGDPRIPASRGPVFDSDNPRVEDLSQFDLAPDLFAEPDAGSLAFQLDDVAPAPMEASGHATLVVYVGSDDQDAIKLSEEEGDVTLGRGRSCRVRLKDARASRLHCRVFATAAGGWAVEDMGSANGTQVNGAFLTARTPQPLSGGEEITIGSTVLRYDFEATASMV